MGGTRPQALPWPASICQLCTDHGPCYMCFSYFLLGIDAEFVSMHVEITMGWYAVTVF